MLTQWCVIVMDTECKYPFTIGPFDTKSDAIEFAFEADTRHPDHNWDPKFEFSVSPYSRAFNWKKLLLKS